MTMNTTNGKTTTSRTTTFADLKVGECFMFVRPPHPLGWPDGPWEKTGFDTVYHLEVGVEAMMESSEAVVRIVQVARWTAERVRRELPPVQVKSTASHGAPRRGGGGGACEFATVYWDGGRSAQWAWETIAHCLNEGRPLLY